MRNPTPPRPQTKSSHHPVRFLYGGSRRNPSLTSQPRHPFRRRTELEAGHQNAAPPSGLGRNRGRGSGEARREEKPHLSRGAAHPLRYSGDRTAPPPRSGRRRGAPKSRIAQAKGEAFSTQFLMGKKWSCGPCFSGLRFAWDVSNFGRCQRTGNERFLWSERTHSSSHRTGRAHSNDGATERAAEHASPVRVRLFPSV